MKKQISTTWGIVILLVIGAGIYWYLDNVSLLTENLYLETSEVQNKDIDSLENLQNLNIKEGTDSEQKGNVDLLNSPPTSEVDKNYKNPIVNPQPENLQVSTINGQVKFGQGDCMPCGGDNCPKRDYDNYNGNLYFIKETALGSLQEGENHTTLFPNSISTVVNNGRYSAQNVPMGNYYLMIPETYIASTQNLINIQFPSQQINKNLEFFECTSY